MGKRWLCGGVFLLAPLLAGADTASRDRPLSSVRSQYFEIVAPDGVSGDYAAAVCDRLIQATRPWLRLPSRFPNRIFVHLEAADRYRYEAPFHTAIELAGNVTVTVRWGADTVLEDLERAVAQALLVRVAAWAGAAPERISVPPWVEAALQRSVRVAGNPSIADGMARAMRERGPLPLGEILHRDRGEPADEFFVTNAYWLLRHLRQHSRRSDRLHNLVVRLLTGGDPGESLLATFGSEFGESAEASLWWAVGVHDQIRRRAVTQNHFYDSRQLVRGMSRFTYRRDGEEVRLRLEDLWEYRNEPVLRADLVRRMEEIRLELALVHPFHFNAVLSLGQVMGSLYDGDEERFRELVAAFRADYREAELLFRETENALDRLEEEMRNRRTGGAGTEPQASDSP